MARPRGIQINQLVGQATWGSILVPSDNFPTTGGSENDSATLDLSGVPELNGKNSGGDDLTEGIYTTSPNNYVQIKGGNASGGFYANYAPIVVEDSVDKNLHEVYAKMTYGTGFELTFYYLDDIGVEKDVVNSQLNSLNGNYLLFRYCETIQFGDQKPTTIATNFETFDEVNVSSKQVDHEHGKEVFTLSGLSQGGASTVTLNMSGTIIDIKGTSTSQDFQVYWNGIKIEQNKDWIGAITYTTGSPNTLTVNINTTVAPAWFRLRNDDLISITYPYES